MSLSKGIDSSRPIARKQRRVPTDDWRDEYDAISRDVSYRDEPEFEDGVSEREGVREVDMSELLRDAKVKPAKLNAGYEFLQFPAAKVVPVKEESAGPVSPEDDWVDVDGELSPKKDVPPKKAYADIVGNGKDK